MAKSAWAVRSAGRKSERRTNRYTDVNIRPSGSNLTPKIVSVLFALLLWFVAVTNTTFTNQITIPIHYTNPTGGTMVAGPLPEDAVVIISGTGQKMVVDFLTGIMGSREQYVLVNLAGLTPGRNQIKIDRTLINMGDSDLSVDSIVSPTNATITVVIDERVRRTIPVATDSIPTIRPERGYVLMGNPEVDPKSVLVEGPGKTVLELRRMQPVSAERSIGVADSVVEADLALPDYTTAIPSGVRLHFRIERIEQRRLDGIPVQVRGFGRRPPTIHPDSITVRVEGAESLVKALKPGDIEIVIHADSFQAALDGGDNTVVPTVTLPKGVTLERLSPPGVRIVPRG